MKASLRRALQPIGIGVILGVISIGWLGYFVTSTGHGVSTDGLGRVLVPSPRLMRLLFGQEKQWAGWLWFVLDLVWFYGGILLGAALVQASGDDGDLDPNSERPTGRRFGTVLAVVLAFTSAYGLVQGAHATVRFARAAGLGAMPSFSDRLVAALHRNGGTGEIKRWLADHRGDDPESIAAGRRMSAQGMRRLPLRDQERRVELQLRMLAAQTPEACGTLIRRGGGSADMDALMAGLGEGADTVADILARALLAELRAGGTGAPADVAPLQVDLVALADRAAAAMVGDTLARFERVRAHIDEAPPGEMCWFTETVLRSALAIEDEGQRARALAALAVLDGGL